MKTIKMWAKMFQSRANSPEDVVRALRDSLDEGRGHEDARAVKKMHDSVSKEIHNLKVILFGDPSNNVDVKTQDVAELVRIACEGDLLLLLATNLSLMEFETRKDAVQIFNNLLRRDDVESAGQCPRAKVAENNGKVLTTLVDGYNNGDIALNCGAILRECVRRYEDLAKLMFNSGLFWRFFELVELNDFDVASDAFSTFKDTLTKHVNVTAKYVEDHKDRFIECYNNLLKSPNYVTRRQSLKLLGEMLLERANFRVMTYYISSRVNLQLIMNLLLDNRKNIQFEAFHVFRIFVANPWKPKEVEDILVRNKGKMLEYLQDFLTDREDKQFQENRQLIIQEIESLRGGEAGEESSPPSGSANR